MTLRVLLTACVAIGMHSSVCTGGFFAITAAIADQAAYTAIETAGPMSYGSIGYLSCKTSTRAKQMESADADSCDDAKTCVSRVSAAVKNSLFVVSTFVADVPLALEPIHAAPEYFTSTSTLARAGPLYEDSTIRIRTTQKIE